MKDALTAYCPDGQLLVHDKTLDEIEKAIHCCFGEYVACVDCPYGKGSRFGTGICGQSMSQDLLTCVALLQQAYAATDEKEEANSRKED